MASKLFQVASRAQHRLAVRRFRRNPLVKAARNLSQSRYFDRSQREFGGAVLDLLEELGTPAVERYAQKQRRGKGQKPRVDPRKSLGEQMGSLFSGLGPLGSMLSAMMGLPPGTQEAASSDVQDAYDAAVELIRAFGGEVLKKDSGAKGYKRGVDAAKQLLEEAGYTVLTPEEASRRGIPPVETTEQEPGTGPQQATVGTPTRPAIQPALSPGLEPPLPEEAAEWSDEILVGSKSSNVWAFQYHYPSSTLRVTFKAPVLNPKSVKVSRSRGGLSRVKGQAGKTIVGKQNAPGPVYHYFDVPARVFLRLSRTSSPGGGVWDELRIRGTAYGHQFRYQLASGAIVPTSHGRMAAYVPRRATKRGFRTRAVAEVGQGRRRYMTSSLPQVINRGTPDRGTPDRGTPNRGR